MANEMQEPRLGNCALESAIAKLHGISQDSKSLIISLIERLAEAEGISVRTEFKPPLENVGHWLTKLRSERKSERTISLYGYLAKRFLGRLPSSVTILYRNKAASL